MNFNVSIFVLLVATASVVSCDIEIPTARPLRVTDALDHEVTEVIRQSEGLFSEEYSIEPFATASVRNGDRKEVHSIIFHCGNENLEHLDMLVADSVSRILAEVIIDNVLNDSNYSLMVIKMTKEDNTIITNKKWTYTKEFAIAELKQ